MIKEDIPLYKLDLTGNSKFNLVLQEYKSRTNVVNNQIFIPPKAPFYQKTFKMYDMGGKELVEGTDYEFYGIMGKLTQYTGKPVGLFVRILKDTIVEWKMDYQVVGNFNVITNEILNMLQSIYQDDRYVFWDNIDNKPLWYIPQIHQHDLAYDIFGFTDLVRELNRIATYVAAMSSASDFMIQSFQDHLEVYIDGYKQILTDMLNSHIDNKMDAHGVNSASIGLGNVANVSTATLEETLDGTRDDLRVSVYNAAKAAEASSGRNDKLFPSGSLPILRYGSDTFIPPTIAGSFEGLGGTSRRSASIVETDGTLLTLNHRNNGKYKGLYFIRCRNWEQQDPLYDFTAYLYQHPTATAAGATLDTVVNGSNRYVMVVGDRAKNMWWWCETHGTLNPDRHVLIRLTGEWVDQDMSIRQADNDIFNIASISQVVADANYADYWAIVQCYSITEMQNRRPNFYPEYKDIGSLAWNNFHYPTMGMSINIVAGKSGTIKRANIDYSHPLEGKFNDRYFTPWIPRYQVINNLRVCKSHYCIYDPPVQGTWSFRSPFAYWLNNGNFNQFAFRYEVGMNTASSLDNYGGMAVWRGTLNITRNGNDFTVSCVPAEGSDKLYTVDFTQRRPGVKDWTQWLKYVNGKYYPFSLDQTGGSVLSGGYIQYNQGMANTAFPPQYSLVKADFLQSPERLLTTSDTGPNDSTTDVSYVYSNLTFEETNPLGMGTLWSCQRILSADSGDYRQSGMMAIQNTPQGPRWFFRYMPIYNSNWDHVKPALSSVFGGKSFQHYPFTPSGFLSNLGCQLFIGTQMPRPGQNNKDNQKKLMGACSDSTIDGTPPTVNGGWPNGVNKRRGDGLWIYDVNFSVVDGDLKMQPITVVDLNAAIVRTFVPALSSLGITQDQIVESWSMHPVLAPNGDWHVVWSFLSPRSPNVLIAAVVTTITPSGTPTVVNGYNKYPDCEIKILSNIGTFSRLGMVNSNTFFHPYYGKNNGTAEPNFIGIPYKAWDRSNGTYDTSGYYIAMTGMTGYSDTGNARPSQFQMEVSADGKTINKIEFMDSQTWGPEANMSVSPYYGIGIATQNGAIFEGAAIANDIYDSVNSIFDNVHNNARSNGNSVIGMSNILTPQYTVYFQQALDVLIAGKMYDVPATYIDILTLDPSPANKIFYIYLQYSNGQAVYKITKDVLPESSTQALIGKVTCGPTQIDRIEPYNRFTMDGAQISAVREGSAILASSGSLFEVGNTSAILLSSDFIS